MTRYALYAAAFLVFALVFFAVAYLLGAVIGLAVFAAAGVGLAASAAYVAWKLGHLRGRRDRPLPRS